MIISSNVQGTNLLLVPTRIVRGFYIVNIVLKNGFQSLSISDMEVDIQPDAFRVVACDLNCGRTDVAGCHSRHRPAGRR